MITACPDSEVTSKDTSSNLEFSEDEESLIARMFSLVGERYATACILVLDLLFENKFFFLPMHIFVFLNS